MDLSGSQAPSSLSRDVSRAKEPLRGNYILVANFEELLIIEDATTDARLALNPFVVGPPHFRFYAGARLVGSRGERRPARVPPQIRSYSIYRYL